jgi:hypothetical protein
MNITIQEAQTITLSEPLVIEVVRDLFVQKRIVAKIQGLPRPVTLWEGDEQYAAAGNWTNETALTQAQVVLALSSIPWA